MVISMIGWRRVVGRIALCLSAAAPAASCGCGSCGLGLHDRITVTDASAGRVPSLGGSSFKDVALSATGDTEFQLASTAMPAKPGLVDAFLVPTSCTKLFDGPYPGAAPLCQVYLGPVAPGKVTSLMKLTAGSYRVWIQGYTSNETDGSYLIDVDIWNHSCVSPLLQ
jgi:hypothetical protein